MLLLIVSLTSGYAQDSLFITRNKPSTSWEEALAIGNGKLGAKVFGGADVDSILLVDNAILTADNTILLEHNIMLKKDFLPFAKLTITGNNSGKANFIKQSLNLNRSLLTDEYEQDGYIFSREHFASYPDRVIGIRIRCKKAKDGEEEKAQKINCTISLTSDFQESAQAKESLLTMTGKAISGNNCTRFCTRIIVNSTDGAVKAKGDCLNIKDASEATLYIINATSEEVNENMSATDAIIDEIELQTERLSMKDYDKVRFFHISDYRNISERFMPSRKDSGEKCLNAIFRNYMFISWPFSHL